MIISLAKEKIAAKLTELAQRLTDNGLFTRSRVFFTDSNFIESAEIVEKSRLIFGELTVRADDVFDDEECIFIICAELKAGEVDDTELDNSIKEFDEETEEFITLLNSSSSKQEAIQKLSEKHQAEADVAAAEMMEELRAARKKLFWGIGAIVVLLVGIVIAGSFF